jgi:cytoskeletal protein CcmA (bactofilin family)
MRAGAPDASPAVGGADAAGTESPGSPSGRFRQTALPVRHEIRCYRCGFEFVLTGRMDKVLCHKCRTFLSTDNHTVDGLWSGRLETIGTVTVTPMGLIKAGEMFAMDLLLHGRVEGGQLNVRRRLELFAGASLDLASVTFSDLAIHAGMVLVPAGPVVCREVTVAGELEAVVECSGSVTVKAGGLFRGTLRAPRMVVEDGATLDADVAVGTAEAVPATAVAVNATDEGERHD